VGRVDIDLDLINATHVLHGERERFTGDVDDWNSLLIADALGTREQRFGVVGEAWS
jgi:hypothetical protein